MTTRLLAVGLLLSLGACSSDTGTSRTADAASSSAPQVRPVVGAVAKRASAFATLPDRGELVGYKASATHREGHSTWHRADVSEAHALRAIDTGKLEMVAPDGQRLEYSYVRHVEHADGNWTWIGNLRDGRQAIITFGERAAFGVFRRPGAEALQLTVRDGVAWIVESDPRALRGVDAPDGQDDYVVPTAAVMAAAANKQPTQSGGMAAASVQTAAATAMAGPTVDVAIGYTNGFATVLGGQSQAVTRVTYLVDLTNQAYVSSNLNAQVRLVRAMQVSYPDATSNDNALSELSGHNGTSSVPIPASLVPLRQARDAYGADLVSLVRQFSDPENEGCGLAWLLGGGGVPITSSDSPWGYSVVSDGSDGGFFCRLETLAHELGHNMGQNHNIEDSGGSTGAHPYSYGYREASSTGFYTIMAYRLDSSQFSIPNFANPNVSYSGRPTGVANASDNVRSLALTMPIIATFRAFVVPLTRPRADFDGDGRSDVLWRNGSTGANVIWKAASSSTPQSVTSVANLSWKVAGLGDFNNDNKADILWRNESSGANTIWRSANATTQQPVTTLAVAWKVAGVGDFDGNGVSDILWRNASTGANVIWKSASSTTSQAVTSAGGAWQVVGIGDFNADGQSDILWRNGSTGANLIWKSGNSATLQGVTPMANLAWKVAGVGDFDGDGKSDILWRNGTTGVNELWKSGNSATKQAISSVPNLSWTVVGAADFDGDGKSDILWRNTSTGGNVIWKSANSATTQAMTAAAVAWSANS